MPVQPLCLWSTTNYGCQQVTLITYPTMDARKIFSKVNLSELILVRSPPARQHQEHQRGKEGGVDQARPNLSLVFPVSMGTFSPQSLGLGRLGSLGLVSLVPFSKEHYQVEGVAACISNSSGV